MTGERALADNSVVMEEAVCPVCGGSGWKILERDGVSGAERCDCVAEARTRRNLEKAGIPPLYRNASLDSFDRRQDNPAHHDLAHVLVTVRGFAREFPNQQRPGLLLMGDPGTGKTHLAVAAFRMLLARGFEGLFFDYQNLIDRIRGSWDANSGSSDREAYRVALDTEILLIDDLGANRVLEWVEDTMTSILTWRCNHRKPLIATTNLLDPEAGKAKEDHRKTLREVLGERARSRLFEMCTVVRMPLVEDYRIRKASIH